MREGTVGTVAALCKCAVEGRSQGGVESRLCIDCFSSRNGKIWRWSWAWWHMADPSTGVPEAGGSQV